MQGSREEVDWSVVWLTDAAPPVMESYVNLVPTVQGGTHVNGFRSGLTEAVREFCEFRSLLPRGLRIAPEDVWDGVSYILSIKLEDPQFSGQTKERLSSRECAAHKQKPAVSPSVSQTYSLKQPSQRLFGLPTPR